MPKQPDIILFNPDQWRGDVLGHLGNPAAQTPVLDGLVDTDAISIEQAFCQNPVCVPSRCSFLTGLYPHHRGHRTMAHMLHPEMGERHIFQVLRDQGYHVWWAGKNDVFDRSASDEGRSEVDERYYPSESDIARWGFTPQEDSHSDKSWRSAAGEAGYYSMLRGRLDKKDEPIHLDYDWMNLLGACEFIERYDGDKPLCLVLNMGYPHPPYACEEPYFSAIDRSALPPRRLSHEDESIQPRISRMLRERIGLKDWSEEQWDELRATYYASCMRVDDQFGRLLQALRKADRYDNAAVFFFSDHGDYTGDYDLVEKNQNTFEDCLTRVPFILKPPADRKIVPGVRHTLAELVDLAATVYDLADVDPGYDHHGLSLLPLLDDPERKHKDVVFCEGGRRPREPQAKESASASFANPEGLYWPRVGLYESEDPVYNNQAAMCRTKEWKYVRRRDESDELYDLANDPDERLNLAGDPSHCEQLQTMRLHLLDWYQRTADTVPQKEDCR